MPKHKTSSILITSCASIIRNLGGILTQGVTAFFLTPADYGSYAIVLGIMNFTTILRGGGTGVVFQTMKLEEFSSIGGGLVRVALGCGILGTIFTIAMILPAEFLYPHDSTKGLGWILFWSSIGFLTFNGSTYPRAKVFSRLMFNQIALMDVASSLGKLATAYYFAANGFGALSLVFAQISNNLIILIWSISVGEMSHLDFKKSPQWIPETFIILRIPIIIALITSLGNQTDLLFSSFFIPVGALGMYLFINQMASQPILMLSSTLQAVLAPYAARVRGNIEQEDLSIRQTFLTGLIFVPLFVMGVAAVYPSLAHLLFGEKWSASIIPVQLSCIFLIFPTVQSLLEAPLMGARRWKITLELFKGRMFAKILGTALSLCLIFASQFILPIPVDYYAFTLIVGVGAVSSIIAFFQIKKVSNQIHISRITFRYEMYSTPAYSILAAIATASLAKSIVDLVGFLNMSIRTEALLELIFCMITYGGVCVVLLRFGYVDNLNTVLQLLPNNPRRLIYKVLFLEERSASLFQRGS